jgi:hypothetical protein
MNDRVRAIVDKMRQNTRAVVEANRERIATAKKNQQKHEPNYKIIVLPIRAPMNRCPNQYFKLQELLI